MTASDYELIIVGSGNGACAFLTQYLDLTAGADARRVLVIEEGADFLSTSFYTHQVMLVTRNAWKLFGMRTTLRPQVHVTLLLTALAGINSLATAPNQNQ